MAEDRVKSPDYEVAYSEMEKLAALGVSYVRISGVWVEGQRDVSDEDLEGFKNASKAAKELGLELIFSAYACSYKECPDNRSPANTWEKGKFNNWLAFVAHSLPDVHIFIVGNEPNSTTFWRPQFKANGADAAAEAYYKLLATSYNVLKKAARERGSEILVGGIATSSTGTQPAETFILNVGKAYRRSGRQQPIMDFIVHHPYGDDSSEQPNQVHSGKTIGIGDYERLVKTIDEAFDGTAQDTSEMPILYGEWGDETIIPQSKMAQYTNKEHKSTHAVTEAKQAIYATKALGLVACQERVIGLTFFLGSDEQDLERLQMGFRYFDGEPKSSFDKIKSGINKFKNTVPDCSK